MAGVERPARPKAPRVGWYRLPRSGVPYHGPIPDGAREIPVDVVRMLARTPTVGQEPVDAGESDGPVGPEVAGVDLPTDPGQPATGPIGTPADDDLDVDPVGHEDEA